MPTSRLVLASASPARLRLLQAAGIEPEVIVSHVPEDDVDPSNPAAMVAVLARRKAETVAAGRPGSELLAAGRLGSETVAAGRPGSETVAAGRPGSELAAGRPGSELVLGCDSTLDVDGHAWGKPASPADAVRRWRQLRDRQATLLTGHHLIDVATGRAVEGVAATVVRFGAPTDDEIDAYVATGEPLAVAGAFTLDGRSAPFINGIDGDPSNVIGCSLPLVRNLVGALGVPWTSLWG